MKVIPILLIYSWHLDDFLQKTYHNQMLFGFFDQMIQDRLLMYINLFFLLVLFYNQGILRLGYLQYLLVIHFLLKPNYNLILEFQEKVLLIEVYLQKYATHLLKHDEKLRRNPLHCIGFLYMLPFYY